MRKLIAIVVAALACAAEPEAVEIQGQQMTRFDTHEALRAAVERQDCRGESPDACLLAKKGRVVMADPRMPGLFLGPELDPREMGRLMREGRIRPTPPLRPGETVIERGLDVGEVSQPLILGSDGRNWPPRPTVLFPNNHPPHGSYASIAVNFAGGKAGSGYMVWGDGPVAVSSAHMSWIGGQVRFFNAGWVLPKEGATSLFWTCPPQQYLTTGWTVYGDWAYDVIVLNWKYAGCTAPSTSFRWYPIEWITHTVQTPGYPAEATLQLWQWGHPGPMTGPCGSSPATVNWPTSCGMLSSHLHQWGTPQMFSADQDSMDGHSGGGNFLSQSSYGTVMVGLHYGTVTCWWPCTDRQGAVVRSPHIENLLATGGVW